MVEKITTITKEIKVKRIIHRGWTEWDRLDEEQKASFYKKSLFGKYQYIYSSVKGEISLVYLKVGFRPNSYSWEIYCLEGEIFEDVERFRTKKLAVERVKELLE